MIHKKICFFSGDITRSGGTERVSSMVAGGLARQGQYEVLFLSIVEQSEDKQPFFSLDKRIRHYALGDRWIQPGPGYLPLIPKLRRFFRRQQVDVVVDIDIVLDILSVPAVFGTKVRVVSWEHFNFKFEMSVGYRRMILRHVTPKVDHIVTLTEADRQAYIKNLIQIIKNPPRIQTISNPMQEYPDGGQDSTGLLEKQPWIITVGHLTHQKGMDLLVQVAEDVLKKYPDWKWLVLGEGEERGRMEGQIRERGLEGRLILVGRTAEVDRYLRQAQIFVLTSRGEGLPMCLLEAKACRLASVSFAIETGPDEIIEDGCNGYLIPPFDLGKMAEQIGRLVEDESLRRTFSENTVKGMEKFQLDVILKKWNEVLRQLCG